MLADINEDHLTVPTGDLIVLEPDHQPWYRFFVDFEYDFYRSLSTPHGLVDAYGTSTPDATEHSWIGRTGHGYRQRTIKTHVVRRSEMSVLERRNSRLTPRLTVTAASATPPITASCPTGMATGCTNSGVSTVRRYGESSASHSAGSSASHTVPLCLPDRASRDMARGIARPTTRASAIAGTTGASICQLRARASVRRGTPVATMAVYARRRETMPSMAKTSSPSAAITTATATAALIRSNAR